MTRPRPRGDRGAAVAEFLLVGVLLVFLLFAVLQVAVYFYLRSAVSAAASAGARYAAGSGVAAAAGGTRAADRLGQDVSPGLAHDLPCAGRADTDGASGLPVVVVRCRGHVHSIFLPVGSLLTIDVTATALKEGG